MNRTPITRAITSHPHLAELQDLERAARRLRAEHVHDPLARLAIVFDLQVRRLAHRLAATLWARGSAPRSTAR